MADGIIFEKLGVQTATLVTDAFRASGDAMAKRMGMPGYHYAMLPHPISNLTPRPQPTPRWTGNWRRWQAGWASSG